MVPNVNSEAQMYHDDAQKQFALAASLGLSAADKSELARHP
jgi:hypothetical protein